MKKKISIIGGGSCALMLGCLLNPEIFDISIYERNAKLGRKFLVAGKGGLNLTHSEPAEDFIKQYTPSFFLESSFGRFSNYDFIKWMNELGIETFVGSSGRIFPGKGTKPIEVLNAFLQCIKAHSVKINTKHTWQGFTKNNGLLFNSNNSLIEVESDYVIFCLGGASWPITGSKGDWTDYFSKKNIRTIPFQASNCGFRVNWNPKLMESNHGKILKNISISCGDKTHFGEVTITRFGLEGSGIYPLSPHIRKQLNKKGHALITIDLKPSFSEAKILEKLKSIADKKNYTNELKILFSFSQAQINILKAYNSKEDFFDQKKLAFHLKNMKLTITETAPIKKAISTVGGISLDEIDSYFQLRKLPLHYCIGEMLDYDAPTGGYLLQSCFSMAGFLSDYLNRKS